MYFIGNLIIEATGSLSEMAELVGKALDLEFRQDFSGRYEEFPAFISDVLGMEIVLLGIPSEEEQNPDDPIKDYELLVRTFVNAPDNNVETNLSNHLYYMLREAGISCNINNTNV